MPGVAAHDGRTREVDPEPGQHSSRTVETNDAVASIHERLGDRHTIPATDVQNARMGRERGRDGKRFSDADSPAAIALVPVSD